MRYWSHTTVYGTLENHELELELELENNIETPNVVRYSIRVHFDTLQPVLHSFFLIYLLTYEIIIIFILSYIHIHTYIHTYLLTYYKTIESSLRRIIEGPWAIQGILYFFMSRP